MGGSSRSEDVIAVDEDALQFEVKGLDITMAGSDTVNYVKRGQWEFCRRRYDSSNVFILLHISKMLD